MSSLLKVRFFSFPHISQINADVNRLIIIENKSMQIRITCGIS